MLHTVSDQTTQEAPPSPETANLPVVHADPNKIAVLLNRNARQVNDRVVRRIESIVGSDHIYYSRSLNEAEAFTREIVQKGYGTIACGGGDGTLCGTINFISRYISESNAWRIQRNQRFGENQPLIGMPRFAFLRLGTGNGMGQVVGAKNPVRDLKRLINYLPGRNHQIPMIMADDELCFVAGFGYDSLLLNDYNALKSTTNNFLLKPLMHTVVGYLAATFLRTVPRALMTDMTLEARVVSRGRGYYIDPRRGDSLMEIEPGTTLFEGHTSMLGAGTSPYFGSGFRAYPFANIMPGMMNLRIATMGPLTTIANLPSIWRGNYRSANKLMDFLVDDVRIELAQPFPFQHSGDAKGLRDNLTLKVAPEPLQMVDFYPPRLLG